MGGLGFNYQGLCAVQKWFGECIKSFAASESVRACKKKTGDDMTRRVGTNPKPMAKKFECEMPGEHHGGTGKPVFCD